jgi:hypothetical protein
MQVLMDALESMTPNENGAIADGNDDRKSHKGN